MDTTDQRYVVGWKIVGETEVEADSPEDAIALVNQYIEFIYAAKGAFKLKSVQCEFARPANEM